jgi:thymidine kinase
MPKLLAVAHDVTKLKSVCEDCKSENGIYSFANFNKTEDVVVGDTEYTTLCHACYMKRLNKRG